ncbi:MAG: hypothetical protein ACQEP1_01000 [Nanobdellota archaeon]
MNNKWFLFGIAFLLIGGIAVSAHTFGSDSQEEDLQAEAEKEDDGAGACPYAEQKAETGECPSVCGGNCGGSCGVPSCGCGA